MSWTFSGDEAKPEAEMSDNGWPEKQKGKKNSRIRAGANQKVRYLGTLWSLRLQGFDRARFGGLVIILFFISIQEASPYFANIKL